jgi:hypothetical protein
VLALLPYSGNFQEIFDRHRWNIEWYWMMFQKDTVVKCWHALFFLHPNVEYMG